MSRTLRVAADVGGTFTDIACLSADGELSTCKIPSTPHDYAQAIIEGLQTLMRSLGARPADLAELSHASTVATNTILEGKGAKTALVTTEGFRDVLELRRIRVPRLYEPLYEKPPPLVPRRRRFEIKERLDSRGNVVEPLDEAQVRALAVTLADADVEAVAISFLHAYANPAHERRVAELLREALPGCFISVSSEVLPEIREYERTSTTVVNAYIGPVVSRYLQSLRERLTSNGIRARLLMMQSSGGTMDVRQVLAKPAIVVESGPAAGVIGAARLGARAGHESVITFDMGGTTAKASLIDAGRVIATDEYEVGGGISLSSRLAKGGGYALKLPVIDVSEVGAGGGSIVRIDAGGALKVGPDSAGAVPGPACYAKGGTEPTVTDASVVLGYLNPHALAGGTVPIERARAQAAVQKVATQLGLDPLETAYGIHRLANSTMMRAVKAVSTYRGRDPREFTLFAFGGNGGVHAAALAEELQMQRVIVPPAAGVFSAVGLLCADLEAVRSTAFLRPLDAESVAEASRLCRALEQQASEELLVNERVPEGVAAGVTHDVPDTTPDGTTDDTADRTTDGAIADPASRSTGSCTPGATVHWRAELRYAGQGFELSVDLPRNAAQPNATAPDMLEVRTRFEHEYHRTYGHDLANHPIEFVALRVIATAPPQGPRTLSRVRRALHRAPTAPFRMAYFGKAHGLLDTSVIERGDLTSTPRPGPLIIEEYEGTTVVPPLATAIRDAHDNIVITLPVERSRAS
ncbi:MAG: hyuA [Gammaproteobacteria bacterium]|nr:hyuA [Gammaproteobacteria bacterium]